MIGKLLAIASCFLIICGVAEASYRTKYNPHTKKLDYVLNTEKDVELEGSLSVAENLTTGNAVINGNLSLGSNLSVSRIGLGNGTYFQYIDGTLSLYVNGVKQEDWT